nr:diguanylate cyclase [uncultured Desulfuromonas sp.]
MKLGIRTKIIALVMMALATLCGGFVHLLVREQADRHQELIQQVDRFIHNSLARELKRTHNIYLSRLDGFIKTNPTIVDSFILGQRQKLFQQLQVKLATLQRENSDFFSVTFIRKDGTVLLRTARYEMSGDSALDIPFVARAFALKQPQYGLTIARWGLAYRLARPIFKNNHFEGIIVFVLRPLSGLDLIYESLGVDTGVLIDKSYQERIKGVNFPVYNGYLLMEEKGSLFKEIPELPDKEEVGHGLIKAYGQQEYLFYSPVELKNYNNEVIGYIQPVSRHTLQQQKHQLVLKKALMTASVLICMTFVVLYFGIGYLLKRLDRLNNTLESRVRERTDELNQVNLALKNEISERENIQQELERLSRYDGLTELINRRYFNELLDVEWRDARRHHHWLTVMMIDVDYFKIYNDGYGHLQGDNCLAQLAQLLKGKLKRARDVVARYGGEEFVCLLPMTDPAEGQQMAESLLMAVRDSGIEHCGSKCAEMITVSIGVSSMVPDAHQKADQLIRQADNALYCAKQKGRNQVQVYKPGDTGGADFTVDDRM